MLRYNLSELLSIWLSPWSQQEEMSPCSISPPPWRVSDNELTAPVIAFHRLTHRMRNPSRTKATSLSSERMIHEYLQPLSTPLQLQTQVGFLSWGSNHSTLTHTRSIPPPNQIPMAPTMQPHHVMSKDTGCMPLHFNLCISLQGFPNVLPKKSTPKLHQHLNLTCHCHFWTALQPQL